MNARAYWTIGGDFVIADADDDDAPLITVSIHEKQLRELARTSPASFANLLVGSMNSTPHPFGEEKP